MKTLFERYKKNLEYWKNNPFLKIDLDLTKEQERLVSVIIKQHCLVIFDCIIENLDKDIERIEENHGIGQGISWDYAHGELVGIRYELLTQRNLIEKYAK